MQQLNVFLVLGQATSRFAKELAKVYWNIAEPILAWQDKADFKLREGVRLNPEDESHLKLTAKMASSIDDTIAVPTFVAGVQFVIPASHNSQKLL